MPTDSWRTNAQLIVTNTQEALQLIPRAAFPVRMMLNASGATSLLEELARADVNFETEEQAAAWFDENETTFQRVIAFYEKAGSFLDEDSKNVASAWKNWFESTR